MSEINNRGAAFLRGSGCKVSDEDIEIAEFWLDQWEEEIAEDESNCRDMYAEASNRPFCRPRHATTSRDSPKLAILAVRRIIAVAKKAKGGEA